MSRFSFANLGVPGLAFFFLIWRRRFNASFSGGPPWPLQQNKVRWCVFGEKQIRSALIFSSGCRSPVHPGQLQISVMFGWFKRWSWTSREHQNIGLVKWPMGADILIDIRKLWKNHSSYHCITLWSTLEQLQELSEGWGGRDSMAKGRQLQVQQDAGTVGTVALVRCDKREPPWACSYDESVKLYDSYSPSHIMLYIMLFNIMLYIIMKASPRNSRPGGGHRVSQCSLQDSSIMWHTLAALAGLHRALLYTFEKIDACPGKKDLRAGRILETARRHAMLPTSAWKHAVKKLDVSLFLCAGFVQFHTSW